MAQDFLLLRQFVASLVRRERWLLAIDIGARTAALLLVALLWSSFAAVGHVGRPLAALLLVALVGVGSWFSLALPLLSAWRDSADPLRQARRVEGLVPELGGRLVTAMGHPAGATGGESEALLGLVVRRAKVAVDRVTPEDVYPAQPSIRRAGVTGGAWLVGLLLFVLLGPGEVLAFWFHFGDAHANVDSAGVKTSEDTARVGDLVLTYNYPDYTGLPPKTIPNSTGDVTGPPGTHVQVTARSGDPVEAAGLLAYDEPLEARVEADGRTVAGDFAIGPEAGTWRLLLYRGGEPERSRTFEITPEKDLPPDVVLEEQDRIEVALDETIELHWQARDDYGVRQVVVALDGKDTERILEQPTKRQADVMGTSLVSPRDLHLAPGDRVALSVAAWDNDTVGGSKRGESRAVEIVVLGATGVDRRAAERRQDLLDALLPILAGMLTDPSPPGRAGGEIARWGEAVAVRYRPISEVMDRLWRDTDTRSRERTLVEGVLEPARKLVRYTQVSFEPSSEEPVRPEALSMVAAMRDESIVALEDAILALAEMLESEAMMHIAAQAKDLQAAADALAQAARDPQSSVQELLARLDQADRMMAQLAKAAEKLQESGLREFVNLRQSELANLRQEIDKALAEGRVDDARRLMQRLAEQMQDLSEGIREQMSRREQQGDEAQQRAEDLKAALEQLEKDQRALQAEVQALRNADQGKAGAVEDLWAELARQIEAHRVSADGYVGGLEQNERPFYEVERARAGTEEAARLGAAVKVRDLAGARLALEEGRMAWAAVGAAVRMLARNGVQLRGPGDRELRTIHQQLEAISDLLDRLEREASEVDPQTLERSREIQGKQDELQGRLEQAQQQADQLARQFPVRPKGMQEALKDANGRMDQASEDLQQGQPMQAEGSQGVAAQRIHEAIESIEQAQQDAAAMARPSAGEEQQGREDQANGSEQMQDRKDLEIPRRDEYVPPAEYRRLLLEGMEGEVPEEYRALKQRYFEELVRQ